MIEQPRHVKYGDKGWDITAYRRALNAYRRDPAAMAGDGWPVLPQKPFRQGEFGMRMRHALQAVKARHPYIEERGLGPQVYEVLAPYFGPYDWWLLKRATVKACPVDVTHGRGTVIGYPYQGTHDHPYAGDDMHNWESCNAIDVSLPRGTPLYAVCEGTIGSQIGPLSSSNPVLLGQRLHLFTADNEWYYAHLSKLAVRAGQHVKAGQLLGESGTANGVDHLHLASKHGDPAKAIGEASPNYRDRGYPG